MAISLIVALDENNIIGQAGQPMLWHLHDDLVRFKELTTGHPIIMGHTTYRSIGQPLPNRTNIIVSHNTNLLVDGAITATSPEEALELAQKRDQTVFIIGGAQLYEALLGSAEVLYVTRVHAQGSGNVSFNPLASPETWKLISQQEVPASGHNDYPYSWLTYVKL